jgi:hypothetical protein
MPSAVPALGHDVSTDYRTHSEDLSAQKLNLSAPNHHARDWATIMQSAPVLFDHARTNADQLQPLNDHTTLSQCRFG